MHKSNKLFENHDQPPTNYVQGGNPDLRKYLTQQLDLIESELARGRKARLSVLNRCFENFHQLITKADQAGISLRERNALYVRAFDLRDLDKEIASSSESTTHSSQSKLPSRSMRRSRLTFREKQLEIDI